MKKTLAIFVLALISSNVLAFPTSDELKKKDCTNFLSMPTQEISKLPMDNPCKLKETIRLLSKIYLTPT